MRDVLGADADQRARDQPEHSERLLELTARRAGDDRRRDLRLAGQRQQLPRPGQHGQRQALAEQPILGRDRAVDHPRQVEPEALSEPKLVEDLAPAVTDDKQALLVRQLDAVVAAQAHEPGHMHHFAVDEGAVEVEEQRTRQTGHAAHSTRSAARRRISGVTLGDRQPARSW